MAAGIMSAVRTGDIVGMLLFRRHLDREKPKGDTGRGLFGQGQGGSAGGFLHDRHIGRQEGQDVFLPGSGCLLY